MPDLQKFTDLMNLKFNSQELLREAFTHRSYLNENTNLNWNHNERLEFLGDAVLELSVTRYLFDTYPDKPEGELTAFRSALVNTVTLSNIAKDIGMNDYLLLSKGEKKDDQGKAREHILANTFEAFLGALYLDQGFEVTDKFISKTVFPLIEEIVSGGLYKDPKSFVQEKAQEIYGTTPTYEVIKEEGPDHDKDFEIAIHFGGQKRAVGAGKSKQEAQQNAAKQALVNEGWISQI